MTWWYYPGADGWQFCYAKEPTFQCPLAKPSDAAQLAAAAEILGITPAGLDRVLQRAHRGGDHHRHRDETGKLTDRCENCGARMVRLGFYCFKQRPFTAGERKDPSVSATVALNERLGTQALKTVKSFYAKTRREAQDWAREEMRLSKGRKTQTGSDR